METSVSSKPVCWWMDEDERLNRTDNERLPVDLMQVACGEAPLRDAFLTLAHYHEIQPCTDRELLEREVWAVTALVEESAAIWDHLTSPTLRFLPDCGRPDQGHLELGRFHHLAALDATSEGEQELVNATSPRWARVLRDPERELRGYNGPLGCAYTPISVEEAVAAIGFGRILARIEAATREAGAAMLAEARSQEERRAQILPVERMLGWHSEPAPGNQQSLPMRLLLLFMTHSRYGWMAAATFLALLVIPLCFLISLPLIFLALVPSMSLLIWKCR